MATKLSIRYLLYLVFTCGFSILVLEFTCVTFLEPYLGTNTVIWANMISLVMIALCLAIIEPYIITIYSTRSDRMGSQSERIFSLISFGGPDPHR